MKVVHIAGNQGEPIKVLVTPEESWPALSPSSTLAIVSLLDLTANLPVEPNAPPLIDGDDIFIYLDAEYTALLDASHRYAYRLAVANGVEEPVTVQEGDLCLYPAWEGQFTPPA